MLVLAPAFKFHSREGRRTTILPVSSSLASVPGSMVVRAKKKNPVHPAGGSSASRHPRVTPFVRSLPLCYDPPVVHIGATAAPSPPVVTMSDVQIAEIHEKVSRYLP